MKIQFKLVPRFMRCSFSAHIRNENAFARIASFEFVDYGSQHSTRYHRWKQARPQFKGLNWFSVKFRRRNDTLCWPIHLFALRNVYVCVVNLMLAKLWPTVYICIRFHLDEETDTVLQIWETTVKEEQHAAFQGNDPLDLLQGEPFSEVKLCVNA